MKTLTVFVCLFACLASAQTVNQPTGNAQFIQGRAVAATAPSDLQVICWDNAGSTWKPCAAASSAAFSAITSATNTTAAMVVGTGASLTFSGSGTINAGLLNGTAFAGTSGNLVGFGAANIPADSGIATSTVVKGAAGLTNANVFGCVSSAGTLKECVVNSVLPTFVAIGAFDNNYVALRRNGSVLELRTGADSTFADMTAAEIEVNSASGGLYVASATGYVYWDTLNLTSRASGTLRFSPAADTTGVTLDAATDATLKVRNFANNADASVTALNLTLSGKLYVAQQTPASASATCTINQFVFDTGFLYVCTATDTWKRVAIASW